MCSIIGWLRLNEAGLPHSDTHGSKLAYSSPWIFAVNHVLHRHKVPRHPPYALSCLNLTLYLYHTSIIKIAYNDLFKKIMVEDNGFEPMTSALQGRRSPSWANPPRSIEYLILKIEDWNFSLHHTKIKNQQSSINPDGPGLTWTADLTLIRRAL